MSRGRSWPERLSKMRRPADDINPGKARNVREWRQAVHTRIAVDT
jgi:hypothetical protein